MSERYAFGTVELATPKPNFRLERRVRRVAPRNRATVRSFVQGESNRKPAAGPTPPRFAMSLRIVL